LRSVRPDVIHLHSFLAGFFGRLPLVSDQVPVVYQPHAWSFDLFGPRLRPLITGWERLAARRTDMLVGNCLDELDEGYRAGVLGDSMPLGVAVDTSLYHPVEESERLTRRRETGLPSSNVLLCLGRLARQKGQDQLIQAWERSPLPDTTLLFAGPGDWESLRGLAPTQWNISIRCVPEQRDVRPWLWACDLLVLPSRYETVAVVVAEAMACGRPVVAVRVNGVAEAVLSGTHPPAGAVVPQGAMAQLLEEAGHRLADRAQLAAEGAAGRTRAEELFATSAVVDRLHKAYDRAHAVRGGEA
jgi:glycosyltransferase involved in cell wall biosynthesis